MPDFGAILNKVQEIFKKLSLIQKLLIGGAVLAVVVGLILVSNVSTPTTYSMLFKSPLSPADYAQVTKKLQEMNVDFDTKDDKYILVKDEETGRQVRMKLGQAGLIPSSIKGWELFDVQKFTTTDFERNVNLQRAIIGEMVRHLKTLNDVEDVSIQVSFPKESLYSDQEKKPTASVIITPAPYTDLTTDKKKIRGIVNLIARGIPNLLPENVVVVDDKGNVLSDLLVPNDLSDRMKVAREQLKIKERERARLIARVKNALTNSINPKRIIISADIEFDWSKMKKKSDKIVPIVTKEDNPLTPYDESKSVVNVPVSEKNTKENFDGPAYIPEGAPGVDNNVPAGLKDKIDRATHYTKDEQIRNYQNSKESIEEEKAPYEIKRVSISVGIDGVWEIVRNNSGDPIITNGGKILRKYYPVDKGEIKNYEDWIKGAVGYDPKRGDIVKVRHISFDHTAEFEKADEKIRKKIQLRRTLLASIVVLFFLFIMTLIYRALAREMERRRRLREEELARQQQAMREAALRAAEEEAATVELSIEEKARMELLENAINISRERPDDVARLIRTWLAEE